ncbi:MAG: hypothetical protein PHF47_02285 [Bacilli bacterium]|nr:hypothetical protein [Bacilli bacterium]
MKKEVLKGIIVFTIIGFLCSLLLFWVYETTKPLIEHINRGSYYEK